MSPRAQAVASSVVIVAAAITLYAFHRERWAELLGAVACVYAIVDAIQRPASTLSRCLLIVGLSLWFVELVPGAAFNLFPQANGTVGVLFLGGFCLVFAGNQMRLRGGPK
ncbi:MAG TPA: hypothetical protein VEI07_10020 [Planctomycetaceae bacterium]|nr:hypothetical protein [Planctomycetaceae bacterium]